MRLIDADKAKAELLRIARDIHDCCGFYDGLRQPEIGDVYFYVAVDEGRNKGVIHNETLFNKNNIKFLLLKKSGKYYKSYFEAEKHLKEDYEYLTGE